MHLGSKNVPVDSLGPVNHRLNRELSCSGKAIVAPPFQHLWCCQQYGGGLGKALGARGTKWGVLAKNGFGPGVANCNHSQPSGPGLQKDVGQ